MKPLEFNPKRPISWSTRRGYWLGSSTFWDIDPREFPIYWVSVEESTGWLQIHGTRFSNPKRFGSRATAQGGRVDSVLRRKYDSLHKGLKAAERFIRCEYRAHLRKKIIELDRQRKALVSLHDSVLEAA